MRQRAADLLGIWRVKIAGLGVMLIPASQHRLVFGKGHRPPISAAHQAAVCHDLGDVERRFRVGFSGAGAWAGSAFFGS